HSVVTIQRVTLKLNPKKIGGFAGVRVGGRSQVTLPPSTALPNRCERIRVCAVRSIPNRRAAIPTLVGGDHVITGSRERQHSLAPPVRASWKAGKRENGRPPRPYDPCL